MPYLQDFASFVKDNKLNDLVSYELMNINSFNIPLMQFFTHLTDEQFLATIRESLLKLLTGFETGTAIDNVKITLANWRSNNISGVPREAISLKDITLVYAAQKLSLQNIIPYYTTDVTVAVQLMNEIELYYKEVQEMAIEMLDKIQREEYEKRLESDEKYRDIFDNANDLIQLVSAEGEILFVNNAWVKTLGYGKDELKGKIIFDLVKRSEVERYKDYREKVMRGEATEERVKTCYIAKNGREVIIEGSISCKFKNGKPEYTRAILRDITSRITQETKIDYYLQQLSEREASLRNVIEYAPDAVIVVDNNNNIVLWNPKAEDIFGWKEVEVKDKKLPAVIIPDYLRERHVAGMKRYHATRQSNIINRTIEVPALRKDGVEFPVSLTISHSIQDGKDVYISFLRDITQQKKNDLELENKRKQLEKINQELEQYAWLASHDLKEPLRKILTFSDAIIKKYADNIPEHAFAYLQKIHSSANRMNGLIEAVLMYSNVASDKTLFTPVNLNTVLEEILEDLEDVISSKNVQLQRDHLPVVEAIPIQMRQLFQNLLSNAIKYSKPGYPPIIHINCLDSEDEYRITVKDNGIGFNNEYAEKIFHVFQRLLNNRSYEGTGIGLALCKKIVEAHNGRIYAESEEGKGSIFFIHLPKVHQPNIIQQP